MTEEIPLLSSQELDIAEYAIRQRWRTRPPKEFPAKWACEWGFDEYGLWQTFEVKGVSHKMRFIPKGSFLMGSQENEEGAFEDEKPPHIVELTTGFWLGETTVTQSLWQVVMGQNASEFKAKENEQLPVENVSWHDCKPFCQKLSELAEAQFTLPTEAQWEYACRAGTATPYSFGSKMTNAQANYGREKGQTVEVHEFQANPWGLKQMHGNVWEWCLDNQRQYQKESISDPVGDTAEQAADAVLRGGSWFSHGGNCRSAYRDFRRRGSRFSNFGLRVAQVEEVEETAGGA